ncbi:MAG: hypothetical protein ACYDEY_13945 [Acidimicrobiales bacterium]
MTNINDVEDRVVDTCLPRDAQAAKVLVADRENPGEITELGRHLWRERITGDSGVLAVNEQTVDLLVEALAVAA